MSAGEGNADKELAYRNGNFMILGEPGSGKSALLSRIVLTACTEVLRSNPNSRLPIAASLSSIVSLMRELHLAERPSAVTPKVAFALLEQWTQDSASARLGKYDVREMFTLYSGEESNGVIVLIDGLDELADDDYLLGDALLVALGEALRTSPGNNLLVIFGRQQVLELLPQLRATDSFERVDLEPFSDAAIYSYISRWVHYRRGSESPEAVLSVLNSVRRNRSLLDTCRNPLALTLYTERFFQDSGQSAIDHTLSVETRAGFFEAIINELMFKRRVQQTDSGVPNAAIRRQRLRFFTDLAHDHLASADAYNHIRSDLVLKHAETLAASEGERERVAHRLAINTGLLALNADDTWSFSHASFLDYFAALSLMNRLGTATDVKRLFQQLVDPRKLRYEEAFYLCCGLMAYRGHPDLMSVLNKLGTNARVGFMYPRACLEAATYTAPGFVAAIRTLCRTWKSTWQADPRLANMRQLQDLVSVVVNYGEFASELGRPPELDLNELLGDVFEGRDLGLLEVARMDINVASRLRPNTSVAELLAGASVEEAVEALLDTDVLERVTDSDLNSRGRLAALLAETALRSAWVARALAPEPLPQISSRRIGLEASNSWARVWTVRGTRYGLVLERGLNYLRSQPGGALHDFPRLGLLLLSKTPTRLRAELVLGSPIRLYLLIAWVLGAAVIVSATSGVILGLATVPLSLFAALAFLRQLVWKGYLSLESMRVLNRHPHVAEIDTAWNRSLPLVRSGQDRPARFSLRRPKSSTGAPVAAYWRGFLPVWRRFSPRLGDAGLPVRPSASLMQASTNSIRRLIQI